jgi:hypothetical protein
VPTSGKLVAAAPVEGAIPTEPDLLSLLLAYRNAGWSPEAKALQARILARFAGLESAREYDDADMKRLGAWVQKHLNHHAGLSWSEGIAREFASLESENARLLNERQQWQETAERAMDDVGSLRRELAGYREAIEAVLKITTSMEITNILLAAPGDTKNG